MILNKLIILLKLTIIIYGKTTIAKNNLTTQELIENYQKNFNIEWISVICINSTRELENILKHIEIPKIIVTKKTSDHKVRKNVSSNLVEH